MTSEKMAAIRELERIELIRQNDGEYRMDYAVTATQKEILKYLASQQQMSGFRRQRLMKN